MEQIPEIRTTESGGFVGERARLHGWLHVLRRMGGIFFLVLRDGYGQVQAVTEDEADVAMLQPAGLQHESVIAMEIAPLRPVCTRAWSHECDHASRSARSRELCPDGVARQSN